MKRQIMWFTLMICNLQHLEHHYADITNTLNSLFGKISFLCQSVGI
jgi:hypothetical protein